MKSIIKKQGITLIALVVTIVILLILAGTTIALLTGDNGIINKAQDSNKQTDIAGIKEKIQSDILSKQSENNGEISEIDLIKVLEEYGILSEENNIMDRILTTKEDKYKIKVSDIYNGRLSNFDVVSDKSGANAPTGNITGKTYVTWELNEDGTEYEINDKQTTQPHDWYDYENGKWANIKTTNNNLEAYWVWIPRYEYIIPESTSATEIKVKFISKNKTVADEGYTIHPAFTWERIKEDGTKEKYELDGIWVAKFEASSNTATPDENYGGGEPAAENPLKVQVKPGVQSWRQISIKNAFLVCRKMTNEDEVLAGSTIKSHLMKNTEWGAVAILSQSKYGIYNPQSSIEDPTDGTNRRIWNNPYGYSYGRTIKTGYVGTNPDDYTSYLKSTAPANIIEYNKIDSTKNLNGTRGSTTGTVYGIYDMAGGSDEYVAACINGKENERLGITENDSIYVDSYTVSTTTNEVTPITGDATKEVEGWNNDDFYYNSSSIKLQRGRLLCR